MLRPHSLILAFVLSIGLTQPASGADGWASALRWLRTQQGIDGGFSNGFSQGSDLAATADAIVAIASAGEAVRAWQTGGKTPLDFVAGASGEVPSGVAAKVVLALVISGEDPRAFAGEDWVATAGVAFSDAASSLYDRALAVLAWHAAGVPAPAGVVESLVAARLEDGSYAFDGSQTPGAGDSNTTALVVQALLVAGAAPETLPSYEYFRGRQNPDRGWTYQKPSAFGEVTDANSTALVIQALLAGGQDLDDWGRPQEALSGLQQPSGALAYNRDTPGDNFLATVQAIPALAGVDLTDVGRLSGTSGNGASAVVLVVGALVIVAISLVAAITVLRLQSGRDMRRR